MNFFKRLTQTLCIHSWVQKDPWNDINLWTCEKCGTEKIVNKEDLWK